MNLIANVFDNEKNDMFEDEEDILQSNYNKTIKEMIKLLKIICLGNDLAVSQIFQKNCSKHILSLIKNDNVYVIKF